jgi:hypothetical protein
MVQGVGVGRPLASVVVSMSAGVVVVRTSAGRMGA